MKLSEMTDDQKNRWIAATLGIPLERPCHLNCGEMHPVAVPNFLYDPAMRDLLQEKLLEEDWEIRTIPLQSQGSKLVRVELWHATKPEADGCGEVGTAIVDAFMRVSGFKED